MNLQELLAQIQTKRTEYDMLFKSFKDDKGEVKADVTDEDVKRAEDLASEVQAMELKARSLEKLAQVGEQNAKAMADFKTPANPLPSAAKTNGVPEIKMPYSGKAWKGVFESEADAYAAGRFYQYALGKSDEAKQWLTDHGYDLKTLATTSEASAGLFVIPQVETAIVRLVEQYGIARQYFKSTSGDTLTKESWKRTGGNTAYFLGEMVTPTATDATWQKLTLSAKELVAQTRYSLRLSANAAVNLAAELTPELAYAHAIKEDQCAFTGDGTSTYGGIIGATYKFRQVLEAAGGTWTTDADKAKLGSGVNAAGNTFAEVTLQNFIDLQAAVANYPGMRPAWFIHDKAAAATMWRVFYASSNVNIDLVNGQPKSFLGSPVVYTNVLPAVDANSQVIALYGDLSLAGEFYQRQGIEISTNTQSDTNWNARSASIMSVEYFDCITHDVGNYHATAANRTRGAVAALISLNS